MAVKRKLSTKGKVITTLIYLLAIAMVVLVIYLNQHPEATEKVVPDVLSNTTTTTEFDKSDLPYNAEGSDKYAGIEPAYKFGDIELRTEGDKKVAYYNNQKAENYTGVCTDGTDWFFVRDGEFDQYYNGIAGNEMGDWYIKDGKVDFTYSGEFTSNSNTYTVDKGKAVKN
ncbi:MAG: hypothetical protein IJ051_02145 [Clostridia bacterium]|nr:hypothetical protein [Clostridia bacterium]